MEVIKNERDMLRMLLFEQVKRVDLLNFEHNKPYSHNGTDKAIMVAEPSTSEACRRYKSTKGSE